MPDVNYDDSRSHQLHDILELAICAHKDLGRLVTHDSSGKAVYNSRSVEQIHQSIKGYISCLCESLGLETAFIEQKQNLKINEVIRDLEQRKNLPPSQNPEELAKMICEVVATLMPKEIYLMYDLNEPSFSLFLDKSLAEADAEMTGSKITTLPIPLASILDHIPR